MPRKYLNLADFMRPPCAWDGFRGIDYEKILALSDEDFRLYYLMRMEEYRDKDGWWQKEKIPECFECHQIIPGPSELRRYSGRSLHGPCFKKVHSEERADEPNELKRRYWDRVAALPDVLTQS